MSIDAHESSVVDSKSYYSSVETLFNVREFYILFQSDCRASAHFVYVTDHGVARKVELLVLHLLDEDNIEFHGACEGSESVRFGFVRDRVNIYCCDVVADVFHFRSWPIQLSCHFRLDDASSSHVVHDGIA